MDACLFYLLLWLEGRKGLLGCKKLKISTTVLQNIMEVLEMLDLDYTEKMEVCCTWKLSTLYSFAPYMGQMKKSSQVPSLSYLHTCPHFPQRRRGS